MAKFAGVFLTHIPSFWISGGKSVELQIWGGSLCSSLVICNEFLKFTSGLTLADVLYLNAGF